MDIGISINTILQILLTAAIGYIGWSSKELDKKSEEKQQAAEERQKVAEIKSEERQQAAEMKLEKKIDKLNDDLKENNKEMFKCFVTKDDHYRDMNALETKIDNIKDILLDVKEDIGKLTGAGGKG